MDTILGDFYRTEQITRTTDTSYRAAIRLNADHAIFRGHFPGNPVTPGVCMMQIIKDLCEAILNKPLFLLRSSNVKFMALINPLEHPLLTLDLELVYEDETHIKVKNVSCFEDTVALKLTNVYKIEHE
ncbi:3-hydroxyacyl-[acyl-carrier-protein] dehydratase [Sphingobacterium allocomposti]|jgi:3-hydroxyacyl-[acyl-carrier-protein] dehydratase|uniref:3-hydroxyacyl-[acyl-carrier-protein] dehydratase n=1 Tax=Sphingobacterium allocomposti TaxID=415956 RepID=A0A5S5DJ55_9SPHI|nr:3-hydroxyacyl-ACP dehydratase [Sphingobacterium composti Yoo et al. 2007 non Ten et al. 2007]TYP95947.1 3-hydroxyacyl-[acyl-carrier-protein] dehydratase [Sphingobacterium composti Yoo et al. 2007 non Ten et al. 2007]HLS96493.1 hypothetical protein [Sphingobacterium sp.]